MSPYTIRARIGRGLDTLLHLHDSPRRTAAAYAVGVFFGFSPFFGLQTICAMGLAFAFRLNRLAVFAGLCTNLPWILPAWYTLTTTAGAIVLGSELPPESAEQLKRLFEYSVLDRDFWQRILAVIRPFLLPFIVGSTVGAALAGMLAYRLLLAILLKRRASRVGLTASSGYPPTR